VKLKPWAFVAARVAVDAHQTARRSFQRRQEPGKKRKKATDAGLGDGRPEERSGQKPFRRDLGALAGIPQLLRADTEAMQRFVRREVKFSGLENFLTTGTRYWGP
jgi:hypothetical protein